jgi:hypothetical protein
MPVIPRHRSRPRTRLRFLVSPFALAAMLLASPVGAQGSTFVRAGVSWNVATVGQGSVGCGTQGINPVPIPSQVAGV